MRISIGQIASTEDLAANTAAMIAATERAAAEGASLIVFPEMAMYFRHALDAEWLENAQAIPGPFTNEIDALAKRTGVAIAVGMIETVADASRVYNTIYVTSAEGERLGLYRKVHLYDAFGLRESDIVAPSIDSEPTLFDLNGVRFGVMTCYDLRFPESARELVDEGAEVLLLPSAWTPGLRKEDHWDVLVRARAIENTTFVLAANQAAPESTGASMFVDPMGIVIAQLVEGAETRTIDFDPGRVAAVRVVNPCVVNRRFNVQRSTAVTL